MGYNLYEVSRMIFIGSDLWVRMSVTGKPCADLTVVTLADEDNNSLPTDDANRAILGNVAKSVTNARSANFWPNLQPMQVAPPAGQNWK